MKQVKQVRQGGADEWEEKFGPTAQKVLVLLLAGASLGLTRSPRQYFRIIKLAGKEWGQINRRALHRAIKKLYEARLLDVTENKDGSVEMILADNGRKKALRYNLDTLRVPPMRQWDKKWRIVLFDIPESRKSARDAISRSLKRAGFQSLQKSVFVHPFDCRNEFDFLVEFFELRPHVRFILAEHIDTELHLKKSFGLS